MGFFGSILKISSDYISAVVLLKTRGTATNEKLFQTVIRQSKQMFAWLPRPLFPLEQDLSQALPKFPQESFSLRALPALGLSCDPGPTLAFLQYLFIESQHIKQSFMSE